MQVRALAYHDTQRYRLGTNFSQLPINRPRHGALNPLRRDGAGNFEQGRGDSTLPPYYPSSSYSLDTAPQYAAPNRELWTGRIVDFESKFEDNDLDQPRDFFEKILGKEPGQQDNLISNIAEHLAEADAMIRNKAYGSLSFSPCKPCPIVLTVFLKLCSLASTPTSDARFASAPRSVLTTSP